MEGSAHRGAVSRPPPGRRVGRFVVAAARPEDDPAIRALLRRQPMDGAIRLSFEREPSARLAAAVEGERHFTAVARERETGRVVGLGSRAVRSVWLDGEPAKLGYLAQLRAPGLASCRRLVAAGYDACEASRQRVQLTRPKAETEARFNLCHFAFLGQGSFDTDFEAHFVGS